MTDNGLDALLEVWPAATPRQRHLFAQAPIAYARAALAFAATAETTGRGRQDSHASYVARIARECLLELLYHGSRPLGSHGSDDTRRYVDSRRTGATTIPGLTDVDLPQWSPTTVTNTTRILDRFRHHLKGGHGDRVSSQPDGNQPQTAKEIATLPDSHAFFVLLSCCNTWLEISLLWLARGPNPDRNAWCRIEPRHVSFHGPSSFVRIQLTNEDGSPRIAVWLVAPGASWAWRLFKRATRKAGHKWMFTKTDGKRPFLPTDFSGMVCTIADRPAARAIPRQPNVKLRLSITGLSDAYLVAELEGGMNPHLAAALRGTGITAVNAWYDAVVRERDQITELARQGVTIQSKPQDARPVCDSCGRDVLDGECIRCGKPQQRTDARSNDAEIRILLDHILAATGQGSRDLLDSARNDLKTHWPAPGETA